MVEVYWWKSILLVFICRANTTCAMQENNSFQCYQHCQIEQFNRISQLFGAISWSNFTLYLTIEKLETQSSNSTVPMDDSMYMCVHICTLFWLMTWEKRVGREEQRSEQESLTELPKAMKNPSTEARMVIEHCVSKLPPFSVWHGDGYGSCQENGKKMRIIVILRAICPFICQQEKEVAVDF